MAGKCLIWRRQSRKRRVAGEKKLREALKYIERSKEIYWGNNDR